MQNLCIPKINKTTSTCNSFLVNSPLKVWPKRYIYKTKLQFCLLQCLNFKMTDRLSKLTSSDSVEWQSLLREIKIRPTHTDTETEGYRRHLQTTDRHPVYKKTKTAQQILLQTRTRIRRTHKAHTHKHTPLTVSHSAVRTETSLHTGEGAAEGIRDWRRAGTRWRTGRTTGLINQTVLTLQRWRHTTDTILYTQNVKKSVEWL